MRTINLPYQICKLLGVLLHSITACITPLLKSCHLHECNGPTFYFNYFSLRFPTWHSLHACCIDCLKKDHSASEQCIQSLPFPFPAQFPAYLVVGYLLINLSLYLHEILKCCHPFLIHHANATPFPNPKRSLNNVSKCCCKTGKHRCTINKSNYLDWYNRLGFSHDIS